METETYECLSFRTVGTFHKSNTGDSIVVEMDGKKRYISIKQILEVLNGKLQHGQIDELGYWDREGDIE